MKREANAANPARFLRLCTLLWKNLSDRHRSRLGCPQCDVAHWPVQGIANRLRRETMRRPLRMLPRDERELDAILAADLAGLW
jgi:hypothetical protein